MIQILDKKRCSGCLACMSACPVNAIRGSLDEEGFTYPQVDEEKCIHCNRCDAACPFLKEEHGISANNVQWETKYYAGQLRNKHDLLEVSSGGAFWALAQEILKMGGVVFGAAQEEIGKVRHIRVVTVEEAKKIRRSKYLQSDTAFIYRRVQEDLENGVTVLFSGTGCQVAGLYGYLKKDYECLYTCEVVCHGVPSSKIWDSYQKERELLVGSPMESIIFRDKSIGWSRNQYRITYKNGFVEQEFSTKHIFHAAYLQGLCYRPSCGVCPFASLPRIADITLADYWRYHGVLRPSGEDLGVSLVVVNNARGEALLHRAENLIAIEPAKKEDAIVSCRHLSQMPAENKDRDAFIKAVLQEGFHVTVQRYIKDTVSTRLWGWLKNKVRRILERFR